MPFIKRALISLELRYPVSEEPKVVTVSQQLTSQYRWLCSQIWHNQWCISLSLCRLMSQQWQAETQEFCPNAKVVLVGCKLDMRTDVSTLRELSKQRLIPVTHEQVRTSRWWICGEKGVGWVMREGLGRCPGGKKKRLTWKQQRFMGKEIRKQSRDLYHFSILDQKWHCFYSEVPKEGSVRGGSGNTINQCRVRPVWYPLGTCCWGWRFDRNLLTSNARLLMARAAQEAWAVSGVYA